MALIDLVQAKVKDNAGLLTDPDDFSAAVSAALARYSGHRPKETVSDLTGDGTHDLALPDDWADGFSIISAVEYPVDEVPESYVAQQDWKLYRKTTGQVLRLVADTPDADETVRLTYTVPRDEADVPDGDMDAVACLAASFCCETLATSFGYQGDPIIGADAVDHKSKGYRFAQRAKRYFALYHQHLGIDPDESAPAAMTIAPAPDPAVARLTHWRR